MQFLTNFIPEKSIKQDMTTYCQLLRQRGFVFDEKTTRIIQKYQDINPTLELLSQSPETLSYYRNNAQKLIDLPSCRLFNFNESVVKNVDGTPDTFTSSSPCIIPYDDGYLMNVRYVNYTIGRKNGSYDLRPGISSYTSINKALWLDRNLQVTRSHWFDTVNNTHSIWHGVEDVRISQNKNQLRYTGVVYKCIPNERNSIGYGIYDLSANYLDGNTAYCSPQGRDCEKNWLQISEDRFVYSWNPLTIINTKGNTIHMDSTIPKFFKMLRGSACYVDEKDIWFLCHIVDYSVPREYYHCIVVLNKETYAVNRYTNLFKIHGDSIEYSLGLIVEPARILISFSQWDSTSTVLSIDRTEFELAMFLQLHTN